MPGYLLFHPYKHETQERYGLDQGYFTVDSEVPGERTEIHEALTKAALDLHPIDPKTRASSELKTLLLWLGGVRKILPPETMTEVARHAGIGFVEASSGRPMRILRDPSTDEAIGLEPYAFTPY